VLQGVYTCISPTVYICMSRRVCTCTQAGRTAGTIYVEDNYEGLCLCYITYDCFVHCHTNNMIRKLEIVSLHLRKSVGSRGSGRNSCVTVVSNYGAVCMFVTASRNIFTLTPGIRGVTY